LKSLWSESEDEDEAELEEEPEPEHEDVNELRIASSDAISLWSSLTSSEHTHELTTVVVVGTTADYWAAWKVVGCGFSVGGAINKQSPFPSLSYPVAQIVWTVEGMQWPFPSDLYPTEHTAGGSWHTPLEFLVYPSAHVVKTCSNTHPPFPSEM